MQDTIINNCECWFYPESTKGYIVMDAFGFNLKTKKYVNLSVEFNQRFGLFQDADGKEYIINPITDGPIKRPVFSYCDRNFFSTALLEEQLFSDENVYFEDMLVLAIDRNYIYCRKKSGKIVPVEITPF